MYKVRVGNDINIQWRIFRNGSPEDFAGKTLRLLMRGTSRTIEVRDYVLEGNVIKWEYKGKDQRGPSTFTFTLIENEGKDDMFTIDKCDVLRLVSCSCQADDDDGPFNVCVDTDIVLPAPGKDGKGAYELAVEYGYEGTEEEFAKMLIDKGSAGVFTIMERDLNNISEENFRALENAIRNKIPVIVVVEDSENYDTWRAVTNASVGHDQIYMNWLGGNTLYLFNGGPGSSPKTARKLAREEDVLVKNSGIEYTPVGDYDPATKKYVDEHVAKSGLPLITKDVTTFEQLTAMAQNFSGAMFYREGAGLSTRMYYVYQLVMDGPNFCMECFTCDTQNYPSLRTSRWEITPESKYTVLKDYYFTVLDEIPDEDYDGKDVVPSLDAVRKYVAEKMAETGSGTDGKTPVLESGETQTLEPGSEATAEIVPGGEDEAGNPRYKVNFGIPAGEPFTYDDFTPGQIEEIKKPALDAAAVALAAANAATKAASNADNAAKTATEAASSANDAADGAGQAAVDAGLAKTAAEEAAVRATEAAGAAGSAAEEANAAAQAASQTNTEVSTAEQGRVTAEEQRASAEQTRQTEFSQLKQDAQTATQEANAAAQAANQAAESMEESLSAKQDKTDESLQTSDKTVTGAINEVNQVVKTKQDKLKAGTGVDITSDNTVNVTLDTTVFKVVASLPESPAAGDENKIHLVPAESTEEGNIYTEYVFVNGKWEEFGTYRSEVDLTLYLKKTDAESTYQKINDSTLATNAKTVVGAINELKSSADTSNNSYMQYLHKVYEEYGAVYNAETGYWELNGLTDLTEEDMWKIYLAGVPKTENLTEFYSGESIRTTFNFTVRGGGTGTGTILKGTFLNCGTVEVVQFNKDPDTPIYAKNISDAFYNCQKLREIVNIIEVYASNALADNMFYNCKALKSVKLRKLRKDISFSSSPLLSYESLNYLVTNAANTTAITVIVHTTTYSYLIGFAEPTEEVGGTTEEWQALVTAAQGKQISFM